MNTSVTSIFTQIKEQFQKISPRTKRFFIILLVVVVFFAVVISLVLNNQPYATLFTGLTSQEATEILGKLQEMEIKHRYENNGTILVPKDQEPLVKAQLVSQGYPKSGFTYDIFTSNIDMMTTDFERNSYKIFDLQDRLAATIRLFDGVQDATVTIAIGEEQRYVLQTDEVPSSASVVMLMRSGGSPSQEQVNGVQRLVSKAVPGMDMDNVAVIDGTGQEVSTDTSGSSFQLGATQMKLNLEREIEASVRAKILHILSPIFGENKVRVSVSGTVDVDKKIKEIIQYLPSEDNKGVTSSEGSYTEVIRGDGAVGGVPGTETNAEVPVYSGVTVDGDEIFFSDEKTYDYVVSQIKEQVQSDAGVLTDLMVSVAVDGAPLSEEKEIEVRKLIATTAGINLESVNDKIALFFDQFITASMPDAPEPPPDNSIFFGLTLIELIVIGGAFLLLMLILIILLAVGRKRRRQKAQAALETAVSEAEYTADIMDISLHDIKNTREMELKQQISEFADNSPEISAQLIRTWLRGVEDS